MKEKEEQRLNRGKVVVFSGDDEKTRMCEVLDVEYIEDGRILTSGEKYVLPVADATIYNGVSGLVYAYNVNLDYQKEVQHLAEVERNVIIQQAFNYQGRVKEQRTPLMMYVLVGILALLSIIGMIK